MLTRLTTPIPAFLELIAHSLDVTPIIAIFTKTPRHDAAEFILAYNVVEFAGDQGGGIPGPEELVGGVEIVLTACGLVSDAVG
jgi:hypothetical protein